MSLTVVVVVTHSGLGVARSVNGGFVYESCCVAAVDRTVVGRVDSSLVDTGALLVTGIVVWSVDGCLTNTTRLLVAGVVAWGVDGGSCYANLLTIVGLEASSVFTLSNVDGAAIVLTGPFDVDMGLGIGGVRSGGR